MNSEVETVRIAVIGLGNELMTDDGVGVHVIRRLRRVLPADVPCVEIGTATLRAQILCERAETVVAVDAVYADGQPGDLYVFDLKDAPTPIANSLHSLSLAELVALITPNKRPGVVIVGVEPMRIECGLDLSRQVEAIIPKVVRLVSSIVTSGDLTHCEIGRRKPNEQIDATRHNHFAHDWADLHGWRSCRHRGL